jgi:ATP-dependent helicase/DNAse subunit B
MSKDKYSAVWVSHSSISDFKKCPRAYYLKNIYKDPKTNNKIQIITPPLALGQAVHEVIESLSTIPTEERFNTPLIEKFNRVWQKLQGEQGGFTDSATEQRYKTRGEQMLRRVTRNPGPLKELAVKIQMELPHFWLSEEDNIILCGKIDWLEYCKKDDSVHIIDFKTSRSDKNEDLTQLEIYKLIAANCQKRDISKASFWYIAQDDKPTERELPDIEKSKKKILKMAKKVKLARQLESFKCPKGEKGCKHCQPFEAIISGKGKKVGTDDIGRDIYVLPSERERNHGVVL